MTLLFRWSRRRPGPRWHAVAGVSGVGWQGTVWLWRRQW